MVYFAARQRPWGTAAECTVVPAERAVPLPQGASFGLGASVGIPAMTAHRCLVADGPVEGRTVLIAGGAGPSGGRRSSWLAGLARRGSWRPSRTTRRPRSHVSPAPTRRSITSATAQAIAAAVADITRALEDRALTEPRLHRFPLARTAEAHHAVEAGAVGKVLVDIER